MLFSCNPHEQYSFTHYNIQAELDPDKGYFSANMQMVYVAHKEYTDSICFDLNPDVSIHTLTVQELEHFRFYGNDKGILVLYIEEPVHPNDQLHISLSYSGRLDEQTLTAMDSTLCWYPANEDTQPFTYQVKLALPGNWYISHPEANTGKHGKWQIQSENPQSSLELAFARR